MMRMAIATLLVLFILSSFSYTGRERPLAHQDVKAVTLAIEDEIYDEGCQGYGADASESIQDGHYELPLYIKPSLNDQDLGSAIYKLLPVGEVLRTFSVDPNGLAVMYGHPEWNFPPTEPSYLTVYMKDEALCQSKHDWVRAKITLELAPSKDRLREAATRQRQRLGDRYRTHRRDCSFSWR